MPAVFDYAGQAPPGVLPSPADFISRLSGQANWNRQQNLTEEEAAQRRVYVPGGPGYSGTLPTGPYSAPGMGEAPQGSLNDWYNQWKGQVFPGGTGGAPTSPTATPTASPRPSATATQLGNRTQAAGGAGIFAPGPGWTGSLSATAGMAQPQAATTPFDGNTFRNISQTSTGGGGGADQSGVPAAMAHPGAFSPVTGNFQGRQPITPRGGAPGPQQGAQGAQPPQMPSVAGLPQINTAALQQAPATASGELQDALTRENAARSGYQGAQGTLNSPVPPPYAASMRDQGLAPFLKLANGGVVGYTGTPEGMASSAREAQSSDLTAQLSSGRQVTGAQDATAQFTSMQQERQQLSTLLPQLQAGAAAGQVGAQENYLSTVLRIREMDRQLEQMKLMFGFKQQDLDKGVAQMTQTQLQPLAEQAASFRKADATFQDALSGNKQAMAHLGADILSVDPTGRLSKQLISAVPPTLGLGDNLERIAEQAATGNVPKNVIQGMQEVLHRAMAPAEQQYRSRYGAALQSNPGAKGFLASQDPDLVWGKQGATAAPAGGDALTRWQAVLSNPNATEQIKTLAQQKIAQLQGSGAGTAVATR